MSDTAWPEMEPPTTYPPDWTDEQILESLGRDPAKYYIDHCTHCARTDVAVVGCMEERRRID